MPEIQSFRFDKGNFEDIKKYRFGKNWPVVYVAHNQKGNARVGGIGVVWVECLAKIVGGVQARRFFARLGHKSGFVRAVG